MIEFMKRTQITSPAQSKGALYQTKIELSTGEISNTYILPFNRVYSIAHNLQGSATIEYTNDFLEDLQKNNGDGDFVPWVEGDDVNLGVVAFRVTNVTGDIKCVVSVKTDNE